MGKGIGGRYRGNFPIARETNILRELQVGLGADWAVLGDGFVSGGRVRYEKIGCGETNKRSAIAVKSGRVSLFRGLTIERIGCLIIRERLPVVTCATESSCGGSSASGHDTGRVWHCHCRHAIIRGSSTQQMTGGVLLGHKWLPAVIHPGEVHVGNAYCVQHGATEETLDCRLVSPLIYVTAADSLPSAATSINPSFFPLRLFRRLTSSGYPCLL